MLNFFKGGFHGGPIPNPPEGIDANNPDWSDPKMQKWLAEYLPHGAVSSAQNSQEQVRQGYRA